MSENSSLNPNVYLNYLQPSVASDYEIIRDVFLITLGAMLWDILASIPDDWKLIQTTKFSPVLFAYFSCRACALAMVLLSTLARTGPIQHCGVLELIVYIFWIFASGSSSYLFLRRVHAIFLQRRLVYHAFTVFWIAAVGASTVVLVGPIHDYYEIAETKHCMNTEIKSYVFVAFFVHVLFDVFVFFAITFQILAFHRTTKAGDWKALCCGQALPRISQAILHGGQQYYMITISVNFSRSIVAILPNIPPLWQSFSPIPAVAITSMMACCVFRNLKLEALQKTEARTLTTLQYADREHTNTHVQKSAEIPSAGAGLEQC